MELKDVRESRSERDARVRRGKALMMRVMRKRLGSQVNESDIEGLANGAWVELQRAIDLGGVRNIEALAVDIARKRALNFLDREVLRQKKHEVLVDPLPQLASAVDQRGVLDLTNIPDDSEDAVSRFEEREEARALVGMIIRYADEGCRRIFAAMVAAEADRELAADMVGKERINSFNQSFGRCVKRIRAILDSDAGPAGLEWRALGGGR